MQILILCAFLIIRPKYAAFCARHPLCRTEVLHSMATTGRSRKRDIPANVDDATVAKVKQRKQKSNGAKKGKSPATLDPPPMQKALLPASFQPLLPQNLPSGLPDIKPFFAQPSVSMGIDEAPRGLSPPSHFNQLPSALSLAAQAAMRASPVSEQNPTDVAAQPMPADNSASSPAPSPVAKTQGSK